MASSDQSTVFLPNWIFEQDYLVFLSFFGWMLVGLLAWTKPLSDNEGKNVPWLWFGYYAFSQAVSDFLRTLSFSDPFFRVFNAEVGFEMLGYGLLVEFGIRYLPQNRGKNFPPYAAVAGLFLGLSIEIGDLLYTLIVSFMVSVVAVAWAAVSFAREAKEEGRRELYVMTAGVVFVMPTWLLAPERLAMIQNVEPVSYQDFPYYGFGLLFVRIVAGWTILVGFWSYRLQRRIDDVAPQVKEQLRFWGYRVLPGALAAIILASYLVTSWNGDRVQDSLERDYLFRSQTAALAMDAEELLGLAGQERLERATQATLASQLAAIKQIGTDVLNVYLWQGDRRGVRTFSFDVELSGVPVLDRAFYTLGTERGFARSESFFMGPIVINQRSILNISSPVINVQTGMPSYWLGIDLAAGGWLQSVSLGRLQTIIIAGLILALVIFFLYYQIDHESEADLILAKERAEAGDRAKSEFLAVISHEIRTPLQSVLGYSALLRGTPLNEKQISCLDTIQSEGKILLRIVQDILDFSNLRKSSFELKEGNVHLRPVIEETFRTIRPMAERKGLSAQLDIAADLPAIVRTDGVRLRQVLLNLFSNSVKYTEEGGVTLRAFVEPPGEDQPRKGKRRFPLSFEISDTGVGIKKADLARLFEPFVQLEHSGRFPREGAGLGLAIVKRIIELMGGRIQVASDVGRGSTFTVSFDFPVVDAAAERVEREREVALEMDLAAPLGEEFPLKTLVVDDNPIVRRLVIQYLESLGFRPDEADGGRRAAEIGHLYDLVVIDLRMPDIDGPQAASIIRRRARQEDYPWIVAVSATLGEAEIERAMSSGVNDFLGKPFFAPQLAETIRKIPWLEERRAAESPEGVEQLAADAPPVRLDLEEEIPGPEIEDEDEDEDENGKSGEPAAAGRTIFQASFPAEAVALAVAEVYELHEKMLRARSREDLEYVRETAHYLANTGMALGIDQLYLDAKDLQSAAEAQDLEKVDKLLPELRLNFEAWDEASA